MAHPITSVSHPDARVRLDGARLPPAFALAARKIARHLWMKRACSAMALASAGTICF